MILDMVCNILNSYEKCIKARPENGALRTTGCEIQTISPIITIISLCSLNRSDIAFKSLDSVVEKDCLMLDRDDWVILTKTRSALRCMVKKSHGVVQTLKFNLAKDKTFIGKISRGFDFLGYRFTDQGIISLAEKAIHNCLQRIATLYEQKASNLGLQQYVRRRVAWAETKYISIKIYVESK